MKFLFIVLIMLSLTSCVRYIVSEQKKVSQGYHQSGLPKFKNVGQETKPTFYYGDTVKAIIIRRFITFKRFRKN